MVARLSLLQLFLAFAVATARNDKLRVMVSWDLDLFFGQEIEQMITVRDIEALSGQLARIRARTKQATPTSAASVLANSGHDKSE